MTKQNVLSVLLRAQQSVSGEQLCRELGISRAAVWKAIDQLRRDGYAIEAAPRRGYRLTGRPDRLEREQIESALHGHPWQGRTAVFASVDSTNNVCKRLAAEGAPEGTAVLSVTQSAGRGRRGRTFISPEGGLYCSVLLRPKAQPESLLHLTAMTAVAAARAIEAVCGVYPGIKWTNDLVLNQKKLCGILTELSIEAETRLVDYVVVGIGINCAAAPLPAPVAEMATSLAAETGRAVDRNALAAALIRALYEMQQALFSGREAWLEEFAAHCVTLGKPVQLLRGDEVRPAFADGIDAHGALLVTFPDGSREAVSCGEVSVRGMYGYV